MLDQQSQDNQHRIHKRGGENTSVNILVSGPALFWQVLAKTNQKRIDLTYAEGNVFRQQVQIGFLISQRAFFSIGPFRVEGVRSTQLTNGLSP